MRTELSSLDLHFLVMELKEIEGAKIEKIFQHEKEIIFQLHSTGKEKQFLKIILPSFIVLGPEKEEFGESGKFGLALRKHIDNARIKCIEQIMFERIVKIDIETKEEIMHFYIELFRPGNAILCNSSDNVKMAYNYKGFGSRLIRPNIKYDFPKKEFNFLDLKESDLVKLTDKSDKSSIVITLATNLGLGGMYAEELCETAGIDKKKTKLEHEDLVGLFKAIRTLKEKKADACIYYDKDELADITPFPLKKYKGLKCEAHKSFASALDSHLSSILKQELRKGRLSKYDEEKKRLAAIIKKQELQIKGFEASSLENQEKGEKIYQNYTKLSKALEDLKKAREKYTWAEIKERLKGSRLVSGIDEKNKKIILELE